MAIMAAIVTTATTATAAIFKYMISSSDMHII